MRILITGANGYLGRALVQKFKKSDINVVEVVRQKLTEDQYACDLLDVNDVSRLGYTVFPDLIIHCAAFVPKTKSEYDDHELSLNNVMMLDNVISSTNCPIFYISSMTVYGGSSKVSNSEDDNCNPKSEYGVSKYKGEVLLKKSGRNAIAVRIPGLFGGARTTGLVYNTINSLIRGEKPSLPSELLTWAAMDVYDAVESIVNLSKINFSGFNPINIAYEDVYSINNFVRICADLFKVTIEYDIAHPDFTFDLSYARNLGVLPDRDLKGAVTAYKASLCNERK